MADKIYLVQQGRPPALDSADFESILRFSEQWTRWRAANPDDATDVRGLVHDSVKRMAAKRKKGDDAGLEGDEYVEELLELFRPSELATRAGLLASHLCKIEYMGEELSPQVSFYTEEFNRLVKVLDLDEESEGILETYRRFLPMEVQNVLQQELQWSRAAEFTLEKLQTRADEIAQRFDSSVQFLRMAGMAVSRNTHHCGKPERTVRRDEAPRAATLRETLASRAAERQRCMTDRLCFKCHQGGHLARECPKADTGKSPAEPQRQLLPQQQQRTGGDGVQRQQQQQLRRSPRIAAKEATTQKDTGSRLTVVAAPAASAAGTVSSTPPHKLQLVGCVSDTQNRPRADLTIIRADGTAESIVAVADSMADKSHLNPDFASKLRLKPVPIEPIEFELGNGSRVRAVHAVHVRARVLGQGPLREMTLYVADNTPPGEYVLIGLADLRGYAVMFTSPPSISFVGTADVADLEDPIDMPGFPPAQAAPATTMVPWRQIAIGAMARTPEQRRVVEDILEKFATVFEPPGLVPAKLRPFTVELLQGAQPVRMKLHHLTPDKADYLRQEMSRLVQLGHFRAAEANCEWAARPVVTSKRNEAGDKVEYRLCFDYTGVNKGTKRDPYPLGDMQEFLRSGAGKPFMFKADMKKGYNQMPVEESSRRCLTVITPIGLCLSRQCCRLGRPMDLQHFREQSRNS